MEQQREWFAMRDLKRPNAKEPAYKMLSGKVAEVYTPMARRTVVRKGIRKLVDAPFIQDLLFVYDSREVLDPIVEMTPTLQYRYLRGGTYQQPMVIDPDEMSRFISFTRGCNPYKFYTLEEVSPAMYGQKIRIEGGTLDGSEGRLMTVRGSRKKRLIVELAGLLAVGVEVSPDCIRLIDWVLSTGKCTSVLPLCVLCGTSWCTLPPFNLCCDAQKAHFVRTLSRSVHPHHLCVPCVAHLGVHFPLKNK